jgi:hypothetical protein
MVALQNCVDLFKAVSASNSETCLHLSHDGNEVIITKTEAIDAQEEESPLSETFTGSEIGQEVSCVCVGGGGGVVSSFNTLQYLPVVLTVYIP